MHVLGSVHSLFLAALLALLAASGAAAQEAEPAQQAPAVQAGELDLDDSAQVEKELERLKQELQREQNEGKDETMTRVLQQHVALLEEHLKLLASVQQQRAQEAGLAAALAQAREQHQAALAELRGLDAMQEVQAALSGIPPAGLLEKFNELYEGPRAALSAEVDLLSRELDELAAEHEGIPGELAAARAELEDTRQKRDQRQQELGDGQGLDAKLAALLQAQLAHRIAGVQHLDRKIAYLSAREDFIDRRVELLQARSEEASSRLERLRVLSETAHDWIQDQVGQSREGMEALQREARRRMRRAAGDGREHERLYYEQRTAFFEHELSYLSLIEERAVLERRESQLDEQLRAAREELLKYQSHYRPGSSLPRPAGDEIAGALERLQAATQMGPYQQERGELLASAERVATRKAETAKTQRELPGEVQAARAAAQAAAAQETWDPATWDELEQEFIEVVSRENRLLGEMVPQAQRLMPVVQELRNVRLELVALLRRENLFLRGAPKITWDGLRQGVSQLQELPQRLLDSTVSLTKYFLDRGHYAALSLYFVVLLVAWALFLIPRRWLAGRLRELYRGDFSQVPVKTAITTLHLAQSAFRSGFLFLPPALAAWILPGLTQEARDLLWVVSLTLGGYWFAQRVNLELFRPAPPQRAVLNVEPASARAAYRRVHLFLLLSLIFPTAIKALIAVGYTNEAILELLQVVYSAIGGLFLVTLLLRRGFIHSLLPFSDRRWARVLRKLAATFQPLLVLLVPALVVLDILRFDFLAGLAAGLSAALLAAALVGYLVYQSGLYFIDRWFAKGGEETEERRNAAATLLKFLLKITVFAAAAWAVFSFSWVSFAELRFFFDVPLPFQGVGVDEKVTWWHLFEAIFIVLVFFAGARYLKLALQEIVLPYTRIDKGLRFTITTLTGYFIYGWGAYLGLTRVFNLESLGYVVAALSVGIGFGLQEIVSNFICGLILLFERPLEVGDTVKIGDTEGVVTRINIRSTTVQSYDNVYILVPNRDLIAQNVVNFTHRDPTMRVRLPLGVAYGSDTSLVKKILLEVADSHGLVLRKPKPQVFFASFGDSALNFELRVWVPTPDERLRVLNDLNFAIDAAFRRAGIEMPFPQRDVHIRSVQGLPSNPVAPAEPKEHPKGE